jgi:hypothetical protein
VCHLLKCNRSRSYGMPPSRAASGTISHRLPCLDTGCTLPSKSLSVRIPIVIARIRTVGERSVFHPSCNGYILASGQGSSRLRVICQTFCAQFTSTPASSYAAATALVYPIPLLARQRYFHFLFQPHRVYNFCLLKNHNTSTDRPS